MAVSIAYELDNFVFQLIGLIVLMLFALDIQFCVL